MANPSAECSRGVVRTCLAVRPAGTPNPCTAGRPDLSGRLFLETVSYDRSAESTNLSGRLLSREVQGLVVSLSRFARRLLRALVSAVRSLCRFASRAGASAFRCAAFRLGVLPRVASSAHPACSSSASACCQALSIVRRVRASGFLLVCGRRVVGRVRSAMVVSILGRFRSSGLVRLGGRPAVAFARFAGSAGFALRFWAWPWLLSGRFQVRTWVFMRVLSGNRPAEWPFSPVMVCSQAVLGGSSWPRCFMVVALPI